MRQLIFLYFLLTLNSLYGQDSLFIKKQDAYSQKLIQSNSIKKARENANNLLEEGKINNDSLYISLAHKYIGNIQAHNVELDSSISSHKISLKYLGSKNKKLYADNLLNIGSRYGDKRDIDSMSYYFEEAKIIYNKINNYRGLCILYSNEANTYLSFERILDAENSLKQLVKYSKKNKDKNSEARAYYYYSVLNATYRNFTKAKVYTKKASTIFKNENNLVEYIQSQAVLSSIYLKKNDISNLKIISEDLISFIELKKLPITPSIVFIYSNYIYCLVEKGNLGKANIFLGKAKNMPKANPLVEQDLWINELRLRLKESNYDRFEKLLKNQEPKLLHRDFKSDYYKLISEYYFNLNKYNLAYKSLYEHNRLNDSLINFDIYKQVSYSQEKFESEKKEKENLQLKADNTEQALLTQKANTRNWILGLGILLLGVSVFFIWRRYNAEAKAKQIISDQKDEIEQQKNIVETLQKELHHRMKNNLSFIDLFINLAKGRFEDKAYQNKLNELQNRMRSMFEVHKQLFKKVDITTVQAKNYIDTLVKNVKQAYEKDSITITNTTNEKETLLANTSFPVGLIVNEFVTNSFKYAFDDQKEGTINIALTSKNNLYQLSLKDNGKGLSKDFDINELDSFGLETIQLLTKEYGGTFEIDGTNGVTMNITLPKTAA